MRRGSFLSLLRLVLKPVGLGAVTLLMLAPSLRAAAQANCQLSAMPSNLGNYSPTSASTIGVTPLTVTCAAGTNYSIGLSAGTGPGASTTMRSMTSSAGAQIAYQLFQDSAHSMNWGNTPPIDTANGAGTGAAQTFEIYPAAEAGQYVAPGTYVDTITATLSGSENKTTTFTVTAFVVASCTMTTQNLPFGNYAGRLTNMVALISVTCTSTTTFNIGLDAGTATGATVTTRRMTAGSGATLNYKMFRDAAHTVNWGSTVGTDTSSGTGTGSPQDFSDYGQIPAGQLVIPGAYADTIIATVSY